VPRFRPGDHSRHSLERFAADDRFRGDTREHAIGSPQRGPALLVAIVDPVAVAGEMIGNGDIIVGRNSHACSPCASRAGAIFACGPASLVDRAPFPYIGVLKGGLLPDE